MVSRKQGTLQRNKGNAQKEGRSQDVAVHQVEKATRKIRGHQMTTRFQKETDRIIMHLKIQQKS